MDRSNEKLKKVFHRLKEEGNILHVIKRRKTDLNGHILGRKCLLNALRKEKYKDEKMKKT